jgi:two-component system sensor histidine kinase LytS
VSTSTLAASASAGIALLRDSLPLWVALCLACGVLGGVAGWLAARHVVHAVHREALRSHHILSIADQSLSHLRRGLSQETAQAVCRIVLAECEAQAVAITDTTRILGFAGIGEEHHEVGGPILTQASRETLERNEARVVRTKAEINCPNRRCPLVAAIVLPLQVRDAAAGTLKFYYTSSRELNETQVAMAEGLARLLSTQLELSELDRQTELACRMELRALQAQINPHFLFNTINTVASLIRTDAGQARELLRDFADFYRATLETGGELIPLGRELDYVRTYFRFEKARFADRVELLEDVAAEHATLLVPAFIVQPLVENAVRHGMRPEGVLHIRVSSHNTNGRVELTVVDDGAGMSAGQVELALTSSGDKVAGFALKNVNDRLKGHFGPGAGLRLTSEPQKGTTVSLAIGRSRRPA